MASIDLKSKFSYKKLIKISIPSILVLFCFTLSAFMIGVVLSIQDEALKDTSYTLYTSYSYVICYITMLYAFSYIAPYTGHQIIAKSLGEGNKDKANRQFFMLFIFTLFFGILETVLGFIFLKPVLNLLGATGVYFDKAYELGIYFCSFLIFFNILVFFRETDLISQKQTRSLIVTAILESVFVGFCFLFICACNIGIKGVAFAFLINWVLGSIYYCFYYFRENKSLLRIDIGKFKLLEGIKSLYYSLPGFLVEFATGIISLILTFWITRVFGDDSVIALNANESAYSIFSILANIGGGFVWAVTPIFAYKYGEKNKEEIKSMFKKSLIILSAIGIFMTILVEALGAPLASIFKNKETDFKMWEMTVNAIRINNASMLLLYLNYFFGNYILSVGHPRLSLILNITRTSLWTAMIFIMPLINPLLIFFALGACDIIMIIVYLINLYLIKKKENTALSN